MQNEGESESVRVDLALRTWFYADVILTDKGETMKTVLYCRVSTTDQTIAHQFDAGSGSRLRDR